MFLLIDRYIARSFIVYFLAGLIVIMTLFIAVDFMTNMGRFGAEPLVLAKYYLLYTPGILNQFVPVACLVATIFTLSTLSKNNELVALFSAGMSLARISLPILTLVVLLSGFNFWIGDRILPIVSQKKNYLYYVEIRKQPGLYSTVKTNRIWYRSNNILFNIKTLEPSKNRAQGLTMYYFDGAWELIQLITASEVELNGRTWNLSRGTVTLFTQEAAVPMSQNFQTKTIAMGEDAKDLQSRVRTSDSLSLSELSDFIAKNKEAGLDTLAYEVEYHGKFSFAFATFIMSFIGIPFSVGRQRQGGLALNIGICIGLTFLYWAAYSSGMTLGKYGVFPPVISVWIPNISMLIVSIFLLLRLKR